MQGLQCFDGEGNLILDVTDRLTRVLGEFDTGVVNGSLIDDGLRTGTPWYNIFYPNSGELIYLVPLVIWTGDNELIWTFARDNPVSLHVMYGVY
jgi:hypothetical protein